MTDDGFVAGLQQVTQSPIAALYAGELELAVLVERPSKATREPAREWDAVRRVAGFDGEPGPHWSHLRRES